MLIVFCLIATIIEVIYTVSDLNNYLPTAISKGQRNVPRAKKGPIRREECWSYISWVGS